MFSQLQLLDWLLKDSRKLISKKNELSPGQLQNISIYLYAVYKIILLDQLYLFFQHMYRQLCSLSLKYAFISNASNASGFVLFRKKSIVMSRVFKKSYCLLYFLKAGFSFGLRRCKLNYHMQNTAFPFLYFSSVFANNK